MMIDANVEQTPDGSSAPPPAEPIDPLKQEMLLQSLRDNQQLTRGITFAFLAALAGTFLWVLITELTHRQIGWMAIGIGFGIAYVMRTVGKGVDPIFGYWSAGLSLFSCVFGNILVIVVEVTKQVDASLADVLAVLLLQPGILIEAMQETFQPLDLLFYGLAVYYGYKYAFRTPTPQEVESISSQRTSEGYLTMPPRQGV